MSKVELGNCQQLAGKRAKEIEAASEVEAEIHNGRFCVLVAWPIRFCLKCQQAKMMKLQKFSEWLKEELADEMKLATGHKDSCEICCREEVSHLISVLFE